MSTPPTVMRLREEMGAWLVSVAFPTWWNAGADHELGGYHDRLDEKGRPRAGAKRARVQARQAFCYSAAPEFGWDGPWRQAMAHGLAFLDSSHRRDDGLVKAWPHGTNDDEPPDLYDQAFALLALASAYRRGDPEAATRAEALLAILPRAAGGGFAELQGDSLLANPNMHVFECCLAWMTAGRRDPWRAVARGQVKLALTRLIDPGTGALSENFGPGWLSPPDAVDQRIEPGHQFEWGWLLMQWHRLEGDLKALTAGLRLVELADRNGIDSTRNVVINALNGDLKPADTGTRLWPQTERLRAAISAALVTDEGGHWEMALSAASGLSQFLDFPAPGLWRDCLERYDNTVLASSFYHIVGAALELERATKMP